MIGTGKPVTFFLWAHGAVKGCGLHGEWTSWMREKDWPSDKENRRWRWLGGRYRMRWEQDEHGPLDPGQTDLMVIGW